VKIEGKPRRRKEYSMINHFARFLCRNIFLVVSSLLIITGVAVVIIPINVAHAATVSCPPQIEEGSTNTVEVNELHSALQSKYNRGGLKNGRPYNFLATSDGAFGGGFGPETRLAVMDYQSQHGLGVDGNVGPQTWGSLLGVVCGSNPNSSVTSNSTISTGGTTSTPKSTVVTCSSVQVPVKDNGKVISCIPIQSTLAYTYCQDGNSVYQQHGMQSEEADCSHPSNLDAQIACDNGYWKDANELTITGTGIFPSGDQQKDRAAADYACNSVYTG
jgi:hypothetical protein